MSILPPDHSFFGRLTSQFEVPASRSGAIRPFKGRNTMKRLSAFSLSAMMTLGLALLPGSTVAQQKSLKEQLVGAWTLVSCAAPGPIWCINPNGILVLDASGRYSLVFAARGRPKSSAASGNRNRAEIPAEEYKAVAQGVIANFGTWSVNEADETITMHRDGALFPSLEGTDFTQSVSLAGDEMKLGGGLVETVYRRVK
jgi:Lipocalin-like domain